MDEPSAPAAAALSVEVKPAQLPSLGAHGHQDVVRQPLPWLPRAAAVSGH